jgi:hypothetical protein
MTALKQIGFFCSICFMTGCGTETTGLLSGNNLSIVAPANALFNQAVAFSVEGGTVLSATWSFVSDVSKASVAPQCTYQENGAIATCTFQEMNQQGSEKIDIQVNYIKSTGTGTLSASIELLLPSNSSS